MPKISPISGRKLIKVLKKKGFVQIRQKGSHVRLEHPDGRKTSIPLHAGEKIGKGLLSKILKDVNLKYDQIRK